MSLIIEYEKNIDTGDQPHISHEPDSTIYQYSVVDEAAVDSSTFAPYGLYNNVTFGERDKHLTTASVDYIGVKNSPGIGGIGFYKQKYLERVSLLAPIHATTVYYIAPELTTAEIVNGKLHLVVTPPAGLQYTCYRVVVRQEAFAFEYIMYKTEMYVDVPTVKGTYTVFCIGYDESAGNVSELSNTIQLTVTTGADNWVPHIDSVDNLSNRVTYVEEEIGDIGTVVDAINGVVI